MTLDGSQLMMKFVNFLRDGDLVDVLVVDTASIDDLRSLGLGRDWFVLPKYVAQPLGALLDLYCKVIDTKYKAIKDKNDLPDDLITDRLYKIVADDYLPVETGVESGVHSILVSYRRMESFRIDFKGLDGLYGYMDGDVQTFSSEQYMLKLNVLSLGMIDGLTTKQHKDYLSLLVKYVDNRDFAVGLRYARGDSTDDFGLFNTTTGAQGYLGLLIDSAEELSACLSLQLSVDDFIQHTLKSKGVDVRRLEADGICLA